MTTKISTSKKLNKLLEQIDQTDAQFVNSYDYLVDLTNAAVASSWVDYSGDYCSPLPSETFIEGVDCGIKLVAQAQKEQKPIFKLTCSTDTELTLYVIATEKEIETLLKDTIKEIASDEEEERKVWEKNHGSSLDARAKQLKQELKDIEVEQAKLKAAKKTKKGTK